MEIEGVGDFNDRGSVEDRLDGEHWSAVPTPQPDQKIASDPMDRP